MGNTSIVNFGFNVPFFSSVSMPMANSFQMIQCAHFCAYSMQNEQRMQQMMQDMAQQTDQQLFSEETSIQKYSQQHHGDSRLSQPSGQAFEEVSHRSSRVSNSDSVGNKPPRPPRLGTQEQHGCHPKWMPQEAAKNIVDVLKKTVQYRKVCFGDISGTDQEILAACVIDKGADKPLIELGPSAQSWNTLKHNYAVKYNMVGKARWTRELQRWALSQEEQNLIIEVCNQGMTLPAKIIERLPEKIKEADPEAWRTYGKKYKAVENLVRRLKLEKGTTSLVQTQPNAVKVYEVVEGQLRLSYESNTK